MAASEIFDKVKKFAGPMGRGLLSQAMPGVCKGILVEYLGGVPLSEVAGYVMKNESLWAHVGQEDREKTQIMVKEMTGGHLEWLTLDWGLNAIRKDLPKVTSLFLGWPEGRAWLQRQLSEIKGNIQSP